MFILWLCVWPVGLAWFRCFLILIMIKRLLMGFVCCVVCFCVCVCVWGVEGRF